MRTPYLEYDSARLYTVHNPICSGLELEIIRTSEDEKVYLNLHGFQLPGEKMQTIQVIMDEQSFEFQASLLEGGQRLLLDPSGADFMIQALSNVHSVTVKIGPYSKEFIPDNFPELYCNLSTDKSFN